EEMEQRFGLGFVIMDRAYIDRSRRERGFGVNPWNTHSRFLLSHRLLADEAHVAPLRAWLDEFRPGSIFVLDEAHHAAPASGQRYAVDSHLTRAVRDLARCFEHRLFLSATPHNGHSNSFSALLEILDPQRFCRGVEVRGRQMLDAVMVRRLKEDLREMGEAFPRREVVQDEIAGLPPDAPELVLAAMLDEYAALRKARLAGEPKRAQAAAGLLTCNLQKRLLSSIEAFARTLAVHRKHLPPAGAAPPAAAPRPGIFSQGVDRDDEQAGASEEERAAEEAEEIAALTAAAPAPGGGRELELLEEMTALADRSRALPDARVRKLLEWIRGRMFSPSGQWNDLRLLIFTEYDDSLRYLRSQLEAALPAAGRIEAFQGPTPAERRDLIKAAFNEPPSQNPLRILIATDAAREGINLQAHCFNLFHFDVPWNPSRMEQRNGRIDRKLQPASEVFCRYFYYRQRPEDKVLAALVHKSRTIRAELGSAADVLDRSLEKILDPGGIARATLASQIEQINDAALDPELAATARQELESTRERQNDLKRQTERLRDYVEESRRATGFVRDGLGAAISSGLHLLGGAPLLPTAAPNGVTEPAFEFPALDQRAGADPSWAATLDTLRPSRRKDQKLAEWRRDSPPRPVVLADPGIVTDAVVQLHLEHRVVQRLLGRFRAQGFVHHDLSRACVAHGLDAIPRVVLLGRVAVYGPAAARLHEELIAVAARWVDPAIREAALAPYGREAEQRTLDQLDRIFGDGLGATAGRPVPEAARRQMLEAAPQDIRDLLPHLEARGQAAAAAAEEQLQRRARQEADDLVEIIVAQRDHIQKKATAYDAGIQQMTLGFAESERRQKQSERKHWARRLEQIPAELENEPARILNSYRVRARRVEPVGLVYLWPVSG
ncbi:MAG: DISARM system SNF2-like helicase DrmD, partial [Terriglobales bacterium]